MREAMFLLLFLVPSIYATLCLPGYEDLRNGNCYKTITNPSTRLQAEIYCEQEGGYLVQPQNAFVNTMLQNEAVTFNTLIWLGITCVGTDKTSCTYSNGDAVTQLSYTNFYPGYPNPSTGNCVFLSASGSLAGQWLSANCEAQKIGFGCQVNPTLPPSYVPPCGSSYLAYGDYCYKTITPKSEQNAESGCELECSHLTSIHSTPENSFVLDLFSRSSQAYAFIGLKHNGHLDYEWIDGTTPAQQDYNNFGYIDPAIGNCVAMSLTNDVVLRGKWINSLCSSNLTSVCKRPKTKPCASFSSGPPQTPTTVPPVGGQTLSPPTCSSTYFLEGTGQIFSPGYPYNYGYGLNCEYVISAPTGSVVFFSVTSDRSFPDASSTLSLYNSVTDNAPFLPRLYYGFPAYSTFYASMTSSMKVKFSSGTSNQYKWTANYTSVDIRASGCNQGVLQTPGTITSPNFKTGVYTDLYPSQYNCTYQLQAPAGQRIYFILTYIYTVPNDDVLYVYDGPDPSSPLLGTFSGENTSGLSVSSSSHQMFVLFASDVRWADPGFTAKFTAI